VTIDFAKLTKSPAVAYTLGVILGVAVGWYGRGVVASLLRGEEIGTPCAECAERAFPIVTDEMRQRVADLHDSDAERLAETLAEVFDGQREADDGS
jgi:hypothetical protein